MNNFASCFAQMLRQADALGWPRYWRTDLDHDKRYLDGTGAKRPFAWYLYECGTHLVEVSPGDKCAIQYVAGIQRSMPGGAWYLWDGTALVEAAVSEVEAACQPAEVSP